MSGLGTGPRYQRHGLYYPYFHIRDDRWLKVAALYWPKMVRIVPQGYQTRDFYTVRALEDDFIMRRPPGDSVRGIAPRFLDLVENHADELCHHFPATPSQPGHRPGSRSTGPWLTGVHVSEIAPQVRDAFVDAQLALPGRRNPMMARQPSSVDGSPILDRHRWQEPPERELDEWILMHPALVAVYTSVLAEDFAAANMLQPTTDQEQAYAVTNNWTADRIATTLLSEPHRARSLTPDELPETLGFLALNLVIPADLDNVPIARIIEIRERYSAEFFAFGEAIDQAAASIAELSEVRDQAVLEDYLQQVVTNRFEQPLADLRKRLKRLTGDAMTVSINVKTQLPAAVTLAGGAWLSGQPLLAGTSAIAIGLMTIRRALRQQLEEALQSAPAVSFLLHTHADLQPRTCSNAPSIG